MIKVYMYGKDDLSEVFNRSQIDDKEIAGRVSAILDDVRRGGDAKLFEYTRKFDGAEVCADNVVVGKEEIEEAYKLVSPELLASLRRAKENVLDYHKRQTERFAPYIYGKGSSRLGWLYRPMSKVGLYIPGGKATYPSSILMCALPAIAAGVGKVVLATPNPRNPLTLVAAKECGIDTIYRIGGAQAIAAMAFGTESVGKVDLIAGPGNVYVTEAKKQVYGHCGIDMVAGPSEILVIADESANSAYVASDMLSQAEHDEMAASILVTTSERVAQEVAEELERQAQTLERKGIIDASLSANGAIIVAESYDDCLEIADAVAPEHLEICTANAEELAMRVKNAGAIFVGNYSPEPLGDYFAGPSHCLPTSGSARYFSVLSVDTFMKKISYIQYSAEDLRAARDDIENIAVSEGLTAHANTVKKRFPK